MAHSELLDDMEIRRRWPERSPYCSVLTFDAGEQPDDLVEHGATRRRFAKSVLHR